MSSTIAEVYGRQILDSRGNPTVEAQITLACGITSTASVPSGASTGVHEAVELRDKNPQLYGGKSVLLAVEHINTCIAREIINLDVLNQTEIDQTLIQLDATECKSRLGANAILAVSIAAARAAAEYLDIPLFRYLGGCCANRLPIPMMNLINGGCHADNKLDIQEFMIVPWGFATFSEALKAGSETYHILKKLLCEKNLFTGLGDEGGFAPCFSNNSSQKDDNNNSVQIKSGTPAEQVFDLLINAIDQAGYKPQTCQNINTENRTGQISLAIDAAASEFYDPQTKRYRLNGQNLDVTQLVDVYKSWIQKYPLFSIEDGCAQDDWDGWELMTKTLIGSPCSTDNTANNRAIQLVGDDLFVTNINRVAQGIERHTANSVLIKPNQIGTVWETIQTIQFAQRNGYKAIVSHRSGETEDTFIADLAVALNCGQIKTGAPTRTDRICKYNQLLRIEEQLGSAAVFE